MMLNPVTHGRQPRNTWCVSPLLELDGVGGFDVMIWLVEHPWCQHCTGNPAPAEREEGPGH